MKTNEMKSTMEFRYPSRSELENRVGEELCFLGYRSTENGKMSFSDGKYWLPFCGSVNAETVKVLLPKK